MTLVRRPRFPTPHPMPLRKYTLDDIAAELQVNGHPGRARAIRDAIERLRQQHETIHQLEQEIQTMARNFTAATDVVLEHDAKTADENATLKKDLDAAKALAKTQEEIAAMAKIVDRSEQISPSPVDAAAAPVV